jgi:hypothetical protein
MVNLIPASQLGQMLELRFRLRFTRQVLSNRKPHPSGGVVYFSRGRDRPPAQLPSLTSTVGVSFKAVPSDWAIESFLKCSRSLDL